MNYNAVSELTEHLKFHPSTIEKEVSRSNLGHFKVGTEIRFTQEHIEEYINVMQFRRTTREIELEKRN